MTRFAPSDEPRASRPTRRLATAPWFRNGNAWMRGPGGRLGAALRRRGGASVLPELAALLCFVALLWAGIALTLGREHASAEASAIETTGNLARAFEESTRRTVGQLDQVLLSARAYYRIQGMRFDFADWARGQVLPDRMTAAIGMTDSIGRVTADTLPLSPGISIADRPHFQIQRDPSRDELYISEPVHGRVSNQDTIQFTRKLLDANGAFAGVLVLSLDCAELSGFYQTVALGGGFVALLRDNGTVLARGPLLPGAIGLKRFEDPRFASLLTSGNGVLSYRSTRTGVPQIASFRHLTDYRLIVMVGLDAGTVFQRYRALRLQAIASGVGITLAVTLIGVFWLRQKHRGIASQRALTITLETISQGILMVDGRGHVPVVNPRALDLLGVEADAARDGRRHAAARAMDLAQRGAAHGLRTIDASDTTTPNGDQDHLFDAASDDGKTIEVRNHRLADGGFVHTYADVTEQRLADARVRYLAHHDPLTGLPNRTQLRQRLPDYLKPESVGGAAPAGSSQTGSSPTETLQTAFLMIDLDGFKGVNDTLGHEVGDDLLVEVGRRLQGLVRKMDFVARLGGDEFVVLLPGLRHAEAAAPMAQRILLRLAEPAHIGDHRLRIGASIGIASHPMDATNAEVLLRHADIALYAAKAAGRGTFRFFDAQMMQAVNEQRLLESDLRLALENDEIQVYFQPLFASRDLALAGFEALARWKHPTRGFVPPDVFIRVAEDSGLINRLGRRIMEAACAAAASWRQPCRLAVNVSVVQLRDGRLQGDIAAILRRTGLPAALLEVEVTESVMAEQYQGVLETLHELKAMGIRIVLDDFGTGYSSLGYLRQFSFDKIKIDKSFVQGQATDQGVRVILEAILGMCRKLDLPVVGEGVETQQQLAMLQEGGCTEMQGYLLGRPMPAAAAEAVILDHLGETAAANAEWPDLQLVS